MRHRNRGTVFSQTMLVAAVAFGCPQSIDVLPGSPDAQTSQTPDGGTTVRPDAGSASTCSNDQLDPGEVCDGDKLDGASCESLGFTAGTLGCLSDCRGYDRSACTNCTPTCGALECGPDPTCGLSCGDCEMGTDCANSGICITTCEPGTYSCSMDGFGWQGCGLDDLTGVNDVGPRIACGTDVVCDPGLGTPCARAECQTGDLVFLVDRSASMAAGSTWSWMHDALIASLDDHDSANRIGVREFPSAVSCTASPLVAPAVDNLANIELGLSSPGGDTSSPIAAALEGLETTFTGRHDAQAIVIVTDGGETCEDEQAALDAASRLFRIGVRVFVIGLTSRADTAFLDRLATVGGTRQHHAANDTNEFTTALDTIYVAAGACANRRAQVTAGYYHACGRQTDGRLHCWGRNLDGQAMPPAGRFVDVDASTDAVCAIDEQGRISCWGRDLRGQINPPTGVFTEVSGGDSHFCALAQNGTVACWGHNTSGQATAPSGAFRQIAVGSFHSCGVRMDGTVECWGQPRPQALSGNYQQIAGSTSYCGVRADEEIVCTSGNGSVPPGPFAQVDIAPDHGCGVRPDGVLVCWGSNSYGQLDVPVGLYVNVAVNNAYTCAVTTDDEFVCWGEGANGQTMPPP